MTAFESAQLLTDYATESVLLRCPPGLVNLPLFLPACTAILQFVDQTQRSELLLKTKELRDRF
jgi:hypothetical protein